MGNLIESMSEPKSVQGKMSYKETEVIWREVLKRKEEWVTLRPKKGQNKVSENSQWLPYENC